MCNVRVGSIMLGECFVKKGTGVIKKINGITRKEDYLRNTEATPQDIIQKVKTNKKVHRQKQYWSAIKKSLFIEKFLLNECLCWCSDNV